jgi:hypothetical protein
MYVLLKTSAVEIVELPDIFSRRVSKMLQKANLRLPYLSFTMPI